MGNASTVDQSVSVKIDLDSVQIEDQKNTHSLTYNSEYSSTNSQLNQTYFQTSTNSPHKETKLPEKVEPNQCKVKKTFFMFKKKKQNNKSSKNDLDLIKSNHLIECELTELKSNKHVQTGNGLISLINLNYYLQSNTEYHLVNRIIKRIGLFNQGTQTDFRSFDEKCLSLIEISQNLVEKLVDLKRDQLIVEEDSARRNEQFNMIYCGKNNHKQNQRNVCIQRCIGQSSVGTQTIESRAHLIVIQIFNRICQLNEKIRSIDKMNNSDLIENRRLCDNKFDLTGASLKSNYNVKTIEKFDENYNTHQLNTKFDECFCHTSDKCPSAVEKTANLIDKSINSNELKSDIIVNDLEMIHKAINSKQVDNRLDGECTSIRMGSDEDLNDISMEIVQTNLESMNKEKLEEYLKNLLLQMSQEHQKKVKSCNACVQTMNDITTDELPEYAARCPSLRKKELIYSSTLFDAFDKRAIEAPRFSKLNDLVDYLVKDCENDMFKVRTLFTWITQNMSFDWKYVEEQHKKIMNTINRFKLNMASARRDTKVEFNNNVINEEDEEAYLKNECLQNEQMDENECNQSETITERIYRNRLGGSKEFVELFMEMCKRCEIRCKLIQGFAKNYDYRPGHIFYEEDINDLVNVHHWTAVFVLGNWHLIDLTWATDPVGKFQRKLNEFFFFTDPKHLIYTHFPINQLERDYERWQLLDKPISLESFNNLPKITANFLALNLKIRSKIANPISFKVQTEIRISSHEPIRYKYKLFHVDELENHALNNFVFCQLKGERLIASFVVCPPVAGRYYFKIYARPEKEMQDQNPINASLHYILTMLLDCSKARKYQNPYPLNELPYGPVQAFYNFKMQLINQHSAIISTFGGKRKLTLQCHEPMMITYQIVDADGQEQDIRAIIQRDDENSTNVITLNILPPRVGLFKLSIFGAPRPKPNQKGKTRLPLLSTFLIDCRLAKIVSKNVDPDPMSADLIDNLGKTLN